MTEELPINCLSDCTSLCCRGSKYFRINFNFTPKEVEMMLNAGAYIIKDPEHKGYMFLKECPFLVENNCQIHKKPQQPIVCQNIQVEDELCLKLRIHNYLGKAVDTILPR
jgi:hypothetical protein